MENKKSILTWLNQQVDEGNELVLRWEGGGDSGWCYFEIDGTQEDNEYTRALVDYMYDVLEYGSWAGEFSASGEAPYDPSTNSFSGTDYYAEDDHSTLTTNIEVRVPKKLWFDQLHIECEQHYDENCQLHVEFHVKNGFLMPEHGEVADQLKTSLEEKYDDLFSNYNDSNEEFRNCYDSKLINRSEFIEEGDDLTFIIKELEIGVSIDNPKDIYFELTDDVVKKIDKFLNEEVTNE